MKLAHRLWGQRRGGDAVLSRFALGTLLVPAAAVVGFAPGAVARGDVLSQRSNFEVTKVAFEEASRGGTALGMSLTVTGTLNTRARSIIAGLDHQGTRWSAKLAVNLAPGPVTLTLPVYWFAQAHALPTGSYDIAIGDIPLEGAPEWQRGWTATLTSGREGLISRSWISRRKNGPPVPIRPSQTDLFTAYVVGPARRLWVHFTFAVLPTLRPLTVSWYDVDQHNRRFATLRRKPARSVATSIALSNGEPLPAGHWRVVLRDGGVPVGALAIQLIR